MAMIAISQPSRQPPVSRHLAERRLRAKDSRSRKLDASRLSVRVLADALKTSPSQVVRLLEENRGSKQLLQLLKLAELAGYRVTFTLKRKPAA